MWIEYALGEEGQKVLAESGRSVPSLKAVAESPVFLDHRPAGELEGVRGRFELMHQLPVTPNWSEVEGLTDDILGELYYGRIEIDEALERLAKETDGKF